MKSLAKEPATGRTILAEWLIFTGVILVGTGLASLLSLLIVIGVFPNALDLFNSPTAMESASAMMLFQVVSSLLIFIAVPYFYLRTFNKKLLNKVTHNEVVPWQGYLYGALLILLLMPVIFWMVKLNGMLELPESLSDLENTMRTSEASANALTTMFAEANGGLLILAIIALVIIPGIGEEFLFRGVLQGKFLQSGLSIHASIWLSAFIFSFIHFQFYGFVPRMVLGALFGYLYYYSGNLWVPMLGHALNNLMATLEIRLLGSEGLDFTNQPHIAGLALIGIYFVGKEFLKTTNPLLFQRIPSDWVVLNEYATEQLATVTEQLLLANDVPAVKINKRDSSYLFGYYQIKVPTHLLSKAQSLTTPLDNEGKEI